MPCSFCGKTKDKVEKIIEGPSVAICDECVELCSTIIAEERRTKGFGVVETNET